MPRYLDIFELWRIFYLGFPFVEPSPMSSITACVLMASFATPEGFHLGLGFSIVPETSRVLSLICPVFLLSLELRRCCHLLSTHLSAQSVAFIYYTIATALLYNKSSSPPSFILPPHIFHSSQHLSALHLSSISSHFAISPPSSLLHSLHIPLPSSRFPSLAMTTTSVFVELGAAGRPTLSSLIEKAICQLRAEGKYDSLSMAPARPARQVKGLPSVPENSTLTTPASERDALKLDMLRRIRSPPLKYAWAFFHSKRSTSANEGQLTAMVENIITIKPFWEVFNQFPLGAMKMKDSVHLFKRGVKPVWEDPRNITGGSWTFRVPKAQTKEFWKETLLLVVGEQFADVIQPRQSS